MCIYLKNIYIYRTKEGLGPKVQTEIFPQKEELEMFHVDKYTFTDTMGNTS